MITIKYDKVADELVNGNWGQTGDHLTEKNMIKDAPDSRLMLVLLIDIAKSLRVLRCQNFKNIPNELRDIRLNTRKPKRRMKKLCP